LIEKARELTAPGERMVLLAEAVELAEQSGAKLTKAVANSMRAQIAAATGSPASALAYAESSLETMREMGLAMEVRKLDKIVADASALQEAAKSLAAATYSSPIRPVLQTDEVVREGIEKEPAAELAERDWIMAVKEKITGAALETGTGVVDALKEGFAISGSQKVSDKLVEVFHKHLGHHVPMASSPIGQQLERFMIPALLHFAAGVAPDKLPGSAVIQKTCLRAITGVAKDDGDAIMGALLPMLGEVLKLGATDGFDLTSMMSGATQVEQVTGAEQRTALAQQSTASQLAASLQQQLDAAEEGEEVVISIKKKGATKKNGKAKAMEEDHGIVPPFVPDPTR
jgi:hypothetical protein